MFIIFFTQEQGTIIMPNSQFIIQLINLKKSIQETESKETKSKGIKKLSDTLKKDLTQYGNLTRFFDELPRELLNNTALKRLEKLYHSLFQYAEFPAGLTGLLRDQIYMMACQDLLDPEGALYPDFITHMGLAKANTALGNETVRNAIMTAYVGYVAGILTSSTTKKEKEITDKHAIKDLNEAPRNFLICHMLVENIHDRLTDFIFKLAIAKELKKIDETTQKKTTTPYYQYLHQVSNLISSDLNFSSPLRKYQAAQFWIDVMSISKSLRDTHNVCSILNGLAYSDVNSKNTYDATSQIKLLTTEMKYYQKIKQTKQEGKEEYDWLFDFLDNDGVQLSHTDLNYDWKNAVKKIFSKDSAYQKHLSQITGKATKTAENKLLSVINQVKIITSELPNFKQPEIKKEPSSTPLLMLTKVWSLFASDPYYNATIALKAIQTELKENYLSLDKIFMHAHDAITALNQILTKNDKNSTQIKTINTLKGAAQEIAQFCLDLKKLGASDKLSFIKSSTENKKRLSYT